MVLLSSLLGPAKPPVASQADVTSAGGVYTLVEYAGSLVAEAVDGNDTIEIGENERCLICLSDYEAAEEIRQLAKCKHLYHKKCIDQVRLSPQAKHIWRHGTNIVCLVVNHGPKLLPTLQRPRSCRVLQQQHQQHRPRTGGCCLSSHLNRQETRARGPSLRFVLDRCLEALCSRTRV